MSPKTGLQTKTARPGGEAGAGLHAAIIMDGNGRWAKRRGMPRALGHRAGVNALKRTVEGAPSAGVGVLTVFGFSTENWRRPAQEVSELMGLLKAYVESDLERLSREGVRVRIIGRRTGLSPDVLEVIERAERRTAHNDSFLLQVAFNYGGQADIADAARRFAEQVERGEARAADLDERMFGSFLSTSAAPAPDLIVRTSGEHRISNFLLWECAYAELVFQDVLWPDYGPEHLAAAVAEYRSRDRRYGGIAADDVAVAG
ncbi:di-trans,poly-cis-decaprenylcistransferase [Caulobacter flavus]|jgi:undecaprenyl diphosphate synthase|uniref:Isoprenyl transferase n=1 Tax=Caulobacter flavus TaxID=1679497 RepID=A0A2N5CUF8_9CAUL|nr:polyprenyl diphosphate synthase [Caulobacter flavus]AYV47833.1 di-trans,poly-cis-decaprenylcistransferase [Caulobacter flavus]PLR16908.1 di-trans,poly-cis-decaprenylcistransferase [Caulobacter flavus]